MLEKSDSIQEDIPIKYGNLQIKKKKKSISDPMISALPPQKIIVKKNGALLSCYKSVLNFWEKLGLESVSGAKDIFWVALYPSPTLETSFKYDFISEDLKFYIDQIKNTYESLNFGSFCNLKLF